MRSEYVFFQGNVVDCRHPAFLPGSADRFSVDWSQNEIIEPLSDSSFLYAQNEGSPWIQQLSKETKLPADPAKVSIFVKSWRAGKLLGSLIGQFQFFTN